MVPIAIPPRIITIAQIKDVLADSPREITEVAIPTTGVAKRPSDVVTVGRLRLTITIAQWASAVPQIPA
jgi:hypothetical protein